MNQHVCSNYLTGIASEYLILSMLCRLGYDAHLTLGNRKNIDIQVIHNGRCVGVDVKAVQGYSSLIVNNVSIEANHVIVFVVYNNKFADVRVTPDVYVVAAQDVALITSTYGDQSRVLKKNLAPHKNAWQIIGNMLQSPHD